MKERQPNWQGKLSKAGMDEGRLERRVIGLPHDIRFDGLSDLLLRARNASVIDVGMNRGHVGYEFAINGARLVHGCDIFAPGVMAAEHWFSELPHCESKFAVVDLTKPNALTAAFGEATYDIVLFLGVYHKLIRIMEEPDLTALVRDLAKRALTYFAFSGYREHVVDIDRALDGSGLTRVHTSELNIPGRPACIYKRLKP